MWYKYVEGCAWVSPTGREAFSSKYSSPKHRNWFGTFWEVTAYGAIESRDMAREDIEENQKCQ